MTSMFEELLAKMRGATALPVLADGELEAMEALATTGMAWDDVADQMLQGWIDSVGGIREFCELRSVVVAAQREAAVEFLQDHLRGSTPVDDVASLIPLTEEIQEAARQLLGFCRAHAEDEYQQLMLCECVAAAHRSVLEEVAAQSLASAKSSGAEKRPRTTFVASDSSTIQMARCEPARLLTRSERLKALQEFQPAEARILILEEYAGCSSAEIARMLEAEDPTGHWTEERVVRVCDAARIFCYA